MNHRDIEYIVCKGPLGAYCTYIKIPEDHPWYTLAVHMTDIGDGRKINTGYDQVPLAVHGGLTFSAEVTNGQSWEQKFTPGRWIGWDYSHYMDYVPGLPSSIDGIWHCLEEVTADIIKAINDMLEVKA